MHSAVSASKVQVFLVKFVFKFRQRCCHFQQYSADRQHFCDVILSESSLSQIILSQTCSKLHNDIFEDSEVENHFEKIDFRVSGKTECSLVIGKDLKN